MFSIVSSQIRFLNVNALVGTFNQEISVILKSSRRFVCSSSVYSVNLNGAKHLIFLRFGAEINLDDC